MTNESSSRTFHLWNQNYHTQCVLHTLSRPSPGHICYISTTMFHMRGMSINDYTRYGSIGHNQSSVTWLIDLPRVSRVSLPRCEYLRMRCKRVCAYITLRHAKRSIVITTVILPPFLFLLQRV